MVGSVKGHGGMRRGYGNRKVPSAILAIGAVIVSFAFPSYGQTLHTAPRGYYTVKVAGAAAPGETARTYLGVQLLPEIRFSGLVSTVSGNRVALESMSGSHDGLADPVRPSYLHVLDGPGKGFITDIAGFDPDGLDCAENPGPWLQAGTRVMLRPHSNLSDLFGADNRFGLGAGTDADSADNVVIWDAGIQNERVYYFHSARSRWEEKNVVADASGASVRFPQGLYLVRRSPGNLRIVLSGDIGADSVLLPVRPGIGVFSLPVNLSGSLDAIMKTTGDFAVKSGPNADSADILTFEEPSSGIQRGPFYYSNRPAVAGWIEVGVDDSTTSLQPLDFLSTLIIRRRAGPDYLLAEGSLEPPSVPRPPLPPDPDPGEVPLTAEFPLLLPYPPEATFTVEISTDLHTWTPHADVTMPQANRIAFPLPSGQGRGFYRVAVTLN